jgi:glycine hydroxymethyltransferase
MNPRAEALLSSGLGSRPSLGYPGDKYEMGLEAIEEIEVIAAELARRSSTRNTPRSAWPRAPWPTSTPSWRPAARRHDHRAARRHRRPCHPPRAGLRGALRAAHPARAGGGGWLHGRHRRAGVPRRTERPRLITIGGSLNLDEHPVADCAPSPTRSARRCSSTRRINAGSSRARVEEPARRRRASDDDEHLQEPRRPRGRADRDQ